MFTRSSVRLHPQSILALPFPIHSEGGEQAGLSGARSQQHLQGLRKQVLSPLGWFSTDHRLWFSKKFYFLSFPPLRHTINTSLFGESRTEAFPCVVRGGGWPAAVLPGTAGSAGLHWAAASQQRFSITGKGVVLSPEAVSKRSPGLWSVSTLELGRRNSLCSRDISGSSSCSVQCAQHCRAFPQLPRCARLGVTSAAG